MEEIKNEETLKEEESPKSENISQNEEPVTNENVAVAEEPQVIEETSDNKDISKNEEEQKKEKSHKIENINEKIRIFEPFLRVIEVIFIGVLSVAVAINANIISDNANILAERANEIADSQLKNEQMEMQPHFSLTRELLPNDEGEENATERITVTVTDGRADNIIIEAKPILEINTLIIEIPEVNEPYKFTNGKIVRLMIFDYFFRDDKGNNDGDIVEFSRNNNHKRISCLENCDANIDEKTKLIFTYRINTIFKIEYTDYIGEKHTDYYSVNSNGQFHFDEITGSDVYEDAKELVPFSVNLISDENIKPFLKDHNDNTEKK